jgi:hypothetical protein
VALDGAGVELALVEEMEEVRPDLLGPISVGGRPKCATNLRA